VNNKLAQKLVAAGNVITSKCQANHWLSEPQPEADASQSLVTNALLKESLAAPAGQALPSL
jgi:hypothetical protein